MPHESFPHVGHNAGLHEPSVEGVAKIVEAKEANLGTADGGLPGGLDFVKRSTFKGEDQSVGLRGCREQIDEPHSERDLASFSLGGFGVGDGKHPTIEVNVFKTLG
jgi:hypothetical protein